MRVWKVSSVQPPPPADGSESHPYRGFTADARPRVVHFGRDGCPQPSAGGGGGRDAKPAEAIPITDGSESHPYRAVRTRP